MSRKVLRLGLIGRGPWGRRYVETIEKIPGVTLARIVGRDWRKILGRKALDGVVIATPPSTHAALARAAIAVGLPVLIEKPLALDAGEARALLAFAREHRAIALVEHTYLFHPAYARAKRQARRLGKIRSLRLVGGNWGPFRADTPPLWDYAPHDLALCLDFTGEEPDRVAAKRLSSRRQDGARAENWRLALRFPSGARATIRLGNAFPKKKRRFEAVLEKGKVFFDDAAKRPAPFPAQLPLNRALEAFARAIRAGRPDVRGLALGARVVALIEKAQASASSI